MSRPVILTVEDDAAVSRAIARDLRRQHGEQYRIVRAESGADPLEVLGELVTSGEHASQRLPPAKGRDVPPYGGGTIAGGVCRRAGHHGTQRDVRQMRRGS